MAFPAQIILYVLNDQFFEVDGVALGLSPTTYENGATVTATLLDPSGQPVLYATNIPMAYVSASQGIYRGQITAQFNPALGGGYKLVVTAVNSSNLQAEWTVKVKVAIRTGIPN